MELKNRGLFFGYRGIGGLLYLPSRMIASIVGNESKRVKEDSTDRPFDSLRREISDLQFIVNHLREDVNFTIEGSKGFVKSIIEREISVLMYAVVEDSVRREVQLKESMNSLQKENEVLIENESGMMEELMRLTLENETLRNNSETSNSKDKLDKDISSVPLNTDNSKILNDTLTVVNELERIVYDDKFLEGIKKKLLESKLLCETMKIELEQLRKSFDLEKESKQSLEDKFTAEVEAGKKLRIEVEALEDEMKNLKNILTDRDKEVEGLKEQNLRLENEIVVLKNEQEEHERQVRDLMTINCELMDLSEAGRIKEQELTNRIDLIEAENSKTKEELETVKRMMTAQKIELERSKELLNRERKVSSLKISDLQEQLEEYKSKELKKE